MSPITVTDGSNPPLELDALRQALSEKRGAQYWRSLEELADTEAFRKFLREKMPQQAALFGEHVDRRQFLSLMGASLALAGLTGCTVIPADKIVPYVKAPEDTVPGKPLYFATAMPTTGGASGLLVESHMGRPTKVDGNPEHPSSLGGSDIFGQASILQLYDPDRSQVVVNRSRITTWDGFLAQLGLELEQLRLKKGQGFRILTEPVMSPVIGEQLNRLLAGFPEARWYQFEPAGRDNVREGARLAFGEYVEPLYHFGKADVVLTLDADCFQSMPQSLRHSREFAQRRSPGADGGMNRLYAVESAPSLAGAMADHRFALRSGQIGEFSRQLAAALKVPGVTASGSLVPWMAQLVEDLEQHRGKCLVLTGDHQPPAVHALVHAINQTLGNVGSTVEYVDVPEVRASAGFRSLAELAAEMNAGAVDTLLVLGGNPVYTAPSDLKFAEAYEKVRLRIHVGLYEDETSVLSHWHIPETHFLESWGDVRSSDGTASVIQPLIEPLYQGKSQIQVLMAFLGQMEAAPVDVVRNYWRDQLKVDGFDRVWRKALHDGVIPGTRRASRTPALRPEGLAASDPVVASGAIEIVFRPDPCVFDGRFANLGWLQELPKPFSKTTWDNPVLLSPATAIRLSVTNSDMVDVQAAGQTVSAPVWILPGHADDAVTVSLGFGRERAGRVGNGVGTNMTLIRSSASPWITRGEVSARGERRELSTTQNHHDMEHRDLVRITTLDAVQRGEAPGPHGGHGDPAHHAEMFHPREYTGYAWGMSINLSACTGCNACVIACQSENNIPVVGRVEVARGREMQWIRIDNYYEGGAESPDIHTQPVACMHCENAPCEIVCPVAATSHSPEGINEMTYNRCVGTRYCSNNCPYKVRRFNFFQYSDFETPSYKLMRNPEVTVRSRGVMEKCTYCVQRVNRARITAEKRGTPLRDGEVVTACQSACPTQAIVFGDINDKESRVAKAKAADLDYGLLTELNTRPRTTYGARVRNPNPRIQA